MAYFDPVSSVYKSVFDAGSVTIASGVATLPVIPTGAEMILVTVDGEGAAADTLDSIAVTGMVATGTLLILRSAASARDITVNSAASSAILINGADDVVLDVLTDSLFLYRNPDGGWSGFVGNQSQYVTSPVLYTRVDVARNLVDDTSTQPIFPTTNDALTVDAGGTYRFRMIAQLTKGANSVSAATLFGGTAGFTTIVYNQLSGHAASGTTVAANINDCVAATACAGVAGTGVNYRIQCEGEFEVSTGGTIIPSVAFSGATGATPAVKVGTTFEAWKKGGNPVTFIGPWA